MIPAKIKLINNRLKLTPEEAFKQVMGVEYHAHKKYIEITASGDTDDGTDALIPLIRYRRTK